MCDERACKTNDCNSFVYCPKCLIINFPLLNIEDIYEMYVNIIETINILAEHKIDVFDVLTPEEMKKDAFELYNKLMLYKQIKEGKNV